MLERRSPVRAQANDSIDRNGLGRETHMTTTKASTASVLKSLIETCKDAQEEFRRAGESVTIPELQSFFCELSEQRQQFALELQHLVLHLDPRREATGSFPDVIRRVWTNLKSVIATGDASEVLVECERCEDAAVAQYDLALDHEELPTSMYNVIQRQYRAVKAAHDRVRDLRERFAG